MMPRWLKVVAILVCIFVVLHHLLMDMTRNVQEGYARRVVFHLEADRNEALQSDVPKAAQILHFIQEGTNTKQTPGSPLDAICSLQRTNAICDIIAYLRTKTGEDLGPMPEPWIEKAQATFSGGDGSSVKDAVVITASSEETGNRAVYIWLHERYPGSRLQDEGFDYDDGGRYYNEIKIVTADGKSRTVFFETTSSFGK